MADVRLADEDAILEPAGHLPEEAAEALLELAVGGEPRKVRPDGDGVEHFDYPDAKRRFRVLKDAEELRRRWTIRSPGASCRYRKSRCEEASPGLPCP